MDLHTIELNADSWPAFAELVERNNGIYGGCWCIGWHLDQKVRLDYRTEKERLVRSDQAHAALVVDDDGVAHGWCQWGPSAELPGFKHRRAYLTDPPPAPDYRIGCIFVDKSHRGQGIARAGIAGALSQIASRGGGLVEAISEVTDGRVAQGRFLFTATVELFEDFGFTRGRQVGKHAWILSRAVEPA